MSISRNGSFIKNFTSLSPVNHEVAVNTNIKKGDEISLYASFYEDEANLSLDKGLVGYTPGYWAGWSYIDFYLYNPSDGSVIEYLASEIFERL